MTIKNPYPRLREACGISQRAFAKKHGFSKMALVLTEAGAYPEVSIRMNEAIAKECADKNVPGKDILREEYGEEWLEDAYWKWQSHERREFAPDVLKVVPPFFHSKLSPPIEDFIARATRNGTVEAFSKRLKVNPVTIRRYVAGKTRTMPTALEDALREIEYPYLAELLEAQLAWYDEHRG
jgi:transcriptional regulator with XRE-family HTH domain